MSRRTLTRGGPNLRGRAKTYEKIAEEYIDDSVTVVYEGIEDGIEIEEEL
jgi:hypothetical protein